MAGRFDSKTYGSHDIRTTFWNNEGEEVNKKRQFV